MMAALWRGMVGNIISSTLKNRGGKTMVPVGVAIKSEEGVWAGVGWRTTNTALTTIIASRW